MKTLLMAGASVLALASVTLGADMKPFDSKAGLWETTTTSETEGMPAMPAMPTIPKETLDKMPPAQRAKIEEMMKSRAAAGAGGARTMTVKVCQTKESMNRMLMQDTKGMDCKRDILTSTASRLQYHVTCTPSGGGPPFTGDGTFNRIDAEHVTGNMVSKITVSDKPMTTKMTFNSKWVSADCGDVKPYTGQ